MTGNSYPRESVEFQPVNLFNFDGVTWAAEDVEVCVTTRRDRPSTWTAPTVLSGKIGIMVEGYTPGAYVIWARVHSSPETPVIKCGEFMVT